jgi:hypothetical protein
MRFLQLLFVLIGVFVSSVLYSQNTACACCTAEYKDFNFWLGEWKVYNPAGKFVGQNTITLMQDSCVLQENWASTGRFRGTSYNFYDAASRKWNQVWVDNQGSNLFLKGEFVNGQMVMTSEEKINQQGAKYVDRISWTPNADGSVRQFWQQSTDGGKVWSTLFDGTYKRAATR